MGGLMYIERLKVSNFKGLKSADLQFRDGINIIVGDNETGKSTVLEAINLALKGQIARRAVQYDLHPFLINADAIQAWIVSHRAGTPIAPPKASVEVFLADDPDLAVLKGSINSEKIDACGVCLELDFDEAYADDLKEYVKDPEEIFGLPIEYYSVTWRSFADANLNSKSIPFKNALIDPSSISNSYSANKYVLEIVRDYLSPAQSADLALSYRRLRENFEGDDRIQAINKDLEAKKGIVSDKVLSVAMDATSKGSWEAGVLPHLDNIPLPLVGKGEQSSVKIKLAMQSHSDCELLLIEEPENHLSHTNLARLVDDISGKTDKKQVILTTHSSFVLNKLGVGRVLMFNGETGVTLEGLPSETKLFFDRLPGHDTLRMILASRSILVEGPSDELIVQKAYKQRHGKMPLSDGVEVISVGTSFKRFLDIAKPLNLEVDIIRDNDGDAKGKVALFDDYRKAPNIRINIDKDDAARTLEPQLIKANGIKTLNKFLAKEFESEETLLAHMTGNKTGSALKIFESKDDIVIPGYIADAIR